MPENLQAIVLASGISERFGTGKTKLAEKICGTELIMYPIQMLEKLNIETTLVTGFQHERINSILKKHNKTNITTTHQEQSLGSGHAASLTQKLWNKDHILLMGADIPLLTEDIILKLYKKHLKTDADISFITAHGIDIENKNYCRIVINDNKIHVLDPNNPQENLESQCCMSGGVYIAKKNFLDKYINQLTKGSITNKYYLPELIQIASDNNCKIVTSPVSIDNIGCVDTLSDLWAIEHIKRSQIIQKWMNKGIRFTNALNVMIDEAVTMDPGVYVGSGVHLIGNSTVKSGTILGAYSYIKNSTIGENCQLKTHTVILDSNINKNSIITPFTYIKNQKVMSEKNKEEPLQAHVFTGATKLEHTQDL